MNQLDAMAARAVDSVHVAVATRAPVADVPRLAGMRRRGVALRLAMGTAALVALVGIAGMVQLDETGDPANPASTTAAPSTTTVAPEVVETPNVAIPIPEGPEVTKLPVTEPPAPPVTEPPATTTPPVTEPPDTTPPPIAITSPKADATVEKTAVTFRGTTEPGATVFSGQWEANVNREGGWSIVLIVKKGWNTARFTATDAAGNQASKTIDVFYEGEVPKEKAPLKAHFTYGSCEFDPPYDIYYGTAEPGALIKVTSEYGSGQVEVDGEGQWEVKVYFPEAPYGETFLVTIKDGLGGVKTFEFTSFAGDA